MLFRLVAGVWVAIDPPRNIERSTPNTVALVLGHGVIHSLGVKERSREGGVHSLHPSELRVLGHMVGKDTR